MKVTIFRSNYLILVEALINCWFIRTPYNMFTYRKMVILWVLFLGVSIFSGCVRHRPPLSNSLMTIPEGMPEKEKPSIWPVEHSKMQITSLFGEVRRGGRRHNGLDIAVPCGTPVVATASGKAVFTGTQSGYGNMIILDHRNGYETLYGHLEKIRICPKALIRRGDVIGDSGASGNATGPHLHYEVRQNGVAINPEVFLPSTNNSYTMSK
jgi:murein DD-endopeptidase MepM/ murein hydrolase activator NlpD